MTTPDEGDAQHRIDDLGDRLESVVADVEALQTGMTRSDERADVISDRVDVLETRTDIDRELLLELQAEGIVNRERTENLEAALRTSRTIGAAVGIVMAAYGVTEVDAFSILKKVSQDRNRKLRALAEEVVLTGSADGLPPR